MKRIKIIQQNRLPHIRPIGATFFITISLADALPRHVINDLKADFEQEKAVSKKRIPPMPHNVFTKHKNAISANMTTNSTLPLTELAISESPM